MPQNNSIYTETQLVQEMKLRNRPVRAILNGSASIRNSLENKNADNEPSIIEYIRQEPMESDSTYQNRMLRTYVTPYLKNAISSAAGQIFKNPITIKTANDVGFDDRLQAILNNVDMQGTDLNEYIMRATEESFAYGMVIAYAGFVNPTGTDNLGEQVQTGARPFLKTISYFDLLGYNFDNQGRITMLRYQEEAQISDEFMGSDRVRQVRVVTPTGYTVYREDESGNGNVYERGEITRFDENSNRITTHIPIEVMYGRKLATLYGASVFEDMAYINLEHTQVNSDLSWSSHFYLIPFLFTIYGQEATPPDSGQGIVPTLASYVQVALPENSDIRWVETNGNAQQAGQRHIESIERRIEVSKMDSSVSVSSGPRQTATGRAIDADSTSAKLKLHAEAVETFAAQIIRLLASFMSDVTLPQFDVIANKDFSLSLDGRTIGDLSDMVDRNQLSLETMLSELKRRGILADDVNVLSELDRINTEMAEQGMMP